MFAEYASALRWALIAIDLAVVSGSFVVAYVLRDQVLGAGELRPLEDHAWLLAAALAIWSACLGAFGFYRSVRYRGRAEVLGQLCKAHALGALVLLSVLFVARRWEVSRLLTQLFLATSFLGLAAEKLALMTILRRLRARGRNARRALVVGAADRTARYLELLREHPYWGIRAIGVADDGAAADDEIQGCPVVGRIKDLPEILSVRPTDEVVFAIGAREFPAVEEYLDLCQEMGVTSRVILDLPHRAWTTQQLDWVDGVGILSLEPVRRSPAALVVKRAIDVIGALAGLVLFGLAALWYAPRIRRESWGPILFRQVRVGRNGRLFTLYKFRTMQVDAEARRADLLAANEMTGHVFKLREDPRVTPIGRELRARHLDELPQFWNVLRGDMSLVGTRPPTVEEVEFYRPHHHRRLSMKPGITGLWQLAGNRAVRDFEEIVKLDCQYIDSWSVWLDLKILARTVLKVTRRSGW
jgi:exopolysaccharide biosynthesis polyprenyl glycosylphosphotransferase